VGFLILQGIYRNMKKIIRLTESELVSLVKRTIMEDNKRDVIEKKVGFYKGKNPILMSLYSKTYNGYDLTDEEIIKAEKEFEKEESPNLDNKEENNPFFLLIKRDGILRKLVIKKGVEAYNNILSTDKQSLFKEYADNHGSNVTIGSPNKDWQNRNLDDLKEFYKNLGNERWSKTNKFNSTLTVKDLIVKIGNKIKNNLSSFKVFTEDGQWSSLNKIDTNYSYWAKSIIDLDNKGLLGNGSPKEKIEEFFKQRLPKDICTPQEVLHIEDIQKNYRVYIEGLSYAEYQIYKDGEKNYEFAKNSIEETSSVGDEAEEEFIGYLKRRGINDIVNFSSPGNQVDVEFGVDLIAKLLEWTPIQVKSKRPYSYSLKIFDFDINGIVVWKKNNNDYYYISSPNDKEPKSFNEDFISLN